MVRPPAELEDEIRRVALAASKGGSDYEADLIEQALDSGGRDSHLGFLLPRHPHHELYNSFLTSYKQQEKRKKSRSRSPPAGKRRTVDPPPHLSIPVGVLVSLQK